MRSILVYDLPLRLFHWAFAGALTASLGIALLADEHSPLFAWHILFGLAAGFLLLLRIVLGFVGARYARFSHLPVQPGKVFAYLRGLFDRHAGRHVGHSPGSAWAALAMFTAVPLLLATGLWAQRDPWEDLHGFLAYALIAVIGLHLAGLVWHTIRHRENIAAAMITGRKPGEPAEAIASAQPGWALAGVVATVAWLGGLVSNYDAAAAKVRLPITGPTIELGEARDSKETRPGSRRRRDDDH